MEPAKKRAKKVDLRVVLRDSEHNKRARAILRQYQRGVDMTQAEFADELSKEFHGRIAMTTLSGYLTGKSNVPGAVLLAASAVAARLADVNPPLTAEERLTLLEDVLYGPAGRKPRRRGLPRRPAVGW